MVNFTRCPRCNHLGSPKLNNYCRTCDSDMFKDRLQDACQGSVKALLGALAEVGAEKPSQVKRKDRDMVVNILKKRQQIKRRKNLVQESSPLEAHGLVFATEPEKYMVEKGVPGIERN